MIVGFCGRKGSGKDTASEVFERHGAVHIKFAGALKSMLVTLLLFQGVEEDVVFRMIEGDLKEIPSDYLGGRSPRYAMQTIGTEWARDLMAPDLWVQVFKAAASKFPLVVCSDVRFPNEVKAINDLGGQVYRVERLGVDRTDEHPSESMIDLLDVDGTLYNAGTSIPDFHQHIYEMFGHRIGPKPSVH